MIPSFERGLYLLAIGSVFSATGLSALLIDFIAHRGIENPVLDLAVATGSGFLAACAVSAVLGQQKV
jgi:hypothetical protein